MNTIRRHITVSVTFIAITFAMALLYGCDSKKGPTLRKGSPLPSISLPDTGGNTLEIPGDIKGKLTVILFWSQGCHYCKKEMPFIEPLYAKYRTRGFSFVAVHMGPGMEAATQMKADMGLSFPLVVDEKATLRKLYGIVSVPTMFVLDENGLISEKVLGGLGVRDIEKMLEENL